MITKPGIYTDIDPAAYLADPCPEPSFSQSIGKVILDQSPAHARLAHPKLSATVDEDDADPEKYDATRAIGDASHALLLGRGKQIAVFDFDSWRGKNADKRTEALAAGKTPILTKHMARAYAMVEAAREQIRHVDHGRYERMFDPSLGDSEVVLAWQENGLWLRTMIDWRAPLVIVDYKSTALSCAPHAVEDRPSVLGWDMQGAMHERGLDILDPDSAGRRSHLFVNQENEPPYALTVIRLSEADLTMGRKKLAMAFDIWSRCMATGQWPAYPPETVISHPRGYTEAQFLEREVAHAERRVRQTQNTRDPENLLAG